MLDRSQLPPRHLFPMSPPPSVWELAGSHLTRHCAPHSHLLRKCHLHCSSPEALRAQWPRAMLLCGASWQRKRPWYLTHCTLGATSWGQPLICPLPPGSPGGSNPLPRTLGEVGRLAGSAPQSVGGEPWGTVTLD